MSRRLNRSPGGLSGKVENQFSDKKHGTTKLGAILAIPLKAEWLPDAAGDNENNGSSRFF
jgi:hypothetical protein